MLLCNFAAVATSLIPPRRFDNICSAAVALDRPLPRRRCATDVSTLLRGHKPANQCHGLGKPRGWEPMVLNDTDAMDETRRFSISRLARLTVIYRWPLRPRNRHSSYRERCQMPLVFRSLGYGAHMVSFFFFSWFPYRIGETTSLRTLQ